MHFGSLCSLSGASEQSKVSSLTYSFFTRAANQEAMALRVASLTMLVACSRAAFSFDLAPAQLCPQQAVYNESMSAWGGSVVEIPTDGTWRYHMYNGIYTKSCGVNYWRGNSAVAHLVSKTPEGPFQYFDEALPLWHTNPQVVVDPRDGTLVLFSIGQTVNQSNWTECNCSAKVPCPPGPPNPNYAGVIDVHYSTSPYGPWLQLLVNGSTVAMRGTNPAPFFLPNGTLVLGINSEGTHVAVVDNWREGPFTLNPTNLLPNNNSAEWYEDPFMWIEGGRWRQLVHQVRRASVGARALSIEGFNVGCLSTVPRLEWPPHCSVCNWRLRAKLQCN